MILALCLALFALSTVLSWSLYGTRCFEYLFGTNIYLDLEVRVQPEWRRDQNEIRRLGYDAGE